MLSESKKYWYLVHAGMALMIVVMVVGSTTKREDRSLGDGDFVQILTDPLTWLGLLSIIGTWYCVMRYGKIRQAEVKAHPGLAPERPRPWRPRF